MPRRALLLAAILATLAGCDQLGIESASVTAARVEADGKAVGAACRHGGRAIEDCFALNKRVDKAAIYAGWRDMDDYMRENKIEPVPPKLDPDGKPRADADADADPGDGSDAASDKPDGAGEADKSGKKDRARTERPAAKDEKPGKAADKGASASSS